MAKKKGTYIVQQEDRDVGGAPIGWSDTVLDASGGDEYGGKMAARQAVEKGNVIGTFRTVKVIDTFVRKEVTQAVIITDGPDKPVRKPRKPKTTTTADTAETSETKEN
jgi:hypothetical protein